MMLIVVMRGTSLNNKTKKLNKDLHEIVSLLCTDPPRRSHSAITNGMALRFPLNFEENNWKLSFPTLGEKQNVENHERAV